MSIIIISILLIITLNSYVNGLPKAIDVIQSAGHLEEHQPNFCNRTDLALENGLQKTALGQFLGYPCSGDFYHCRWQSDGYRTYKKSCRVGLVFDTAGTQNCNYDYNVKGCAITSNPGKCSNITDFACPLSEHCVSISQRCDGVYDCVLEEDEQNCPICKREEFPCVTSEQCVPSSARCNGIPECRDGTDEQDCEVCPADNFFCRKSQKCIPASERCDGIQQCPYEEDEQLCKRNSTQMYTCENRQAQPDCPDGSDEKYCLNAPNQPLTGEKSVEENTISETPLPASSQNTVVNQAPGEVPSPISSDKVPAGTGKLAFPRIQFNGHSEEGGQTEENNQPGPGQEMAEDSSPATVVVSGRGESNTGHVSSAEQTTYGPYLVGVGDPAATSEKSPVMHMMKKYHLPEKNTADCEQAAPNDKEVQVASDYKPPSATTTICSQTYPGSSHSIQITCPPTTSNDCLHVSTPCPQIEVAEYVGRQGRKQFTQPTTVNLFWAETLAPPRAILNEIKKVDPLQELSQRYGTSRNELIKKIEQILRNETNLQPQDSPPSSGSMFTPPGVQTTAEPVFHKLQKTIHVTARPHKWHPSLSTKQNRPKTTTSQTFFRSHKQAGGSNRASVNTKFHK